MEFVQRGVDLRGMIKSKSADGFVVIIVGVVDEDLYVAASTKSFLIGARWVSDVQAKVDQYGIPAPTPTKMKAILKIIANQKLWFYNCSFDDPVPTKIVALCCANTYGRSVDPDEKEMAEMFQKILKDGDNNPIIKQALLCHLMAGKSL